MILCKMLLLVIFERGTGDNENPPYFDKVSQNRGGFLHCYIKLNLCIHCCA